MFLYDINSFPAGLTVNAWLDLYDKDIVVYDSKIGVTPIRIEGNTIAFIDINSMDLNELKLVREKIEELHAEDIKKAESNAEIFRINNQKLIDYLKNINNEKI